MTFNEFIANDPEYANLGSGYMGLVQKAYEAGIEKGKWIKVEEIARQVHQESTYVLFLAKEEVFLLENILKDVSQWGYVKSLFDKVTVLSNKLSLEKE